ncbi:hypothetical protein IE53DRAFT_23042 [Violaceomyces palustris]|uniref:Uncharacterized protein n=1 Tax=Violaceomyces palustris TaxID=1673888 RepID=A0ACD0NLD1_9BASI|nr:hypothetical protein IE53DRAFT_23042 [Violaceomyces palustris]
MLVSKVLLLVRFRDRDPTPPPFTSKPSLSSSPPPPPPPPRPCCSQIRPYRFAKPYFSQVPIPPPFLRLTTFLPLIPPLSFTLSPSFTTQPHTPSPPLFTTSFRALNPSPPTRDVFHFISFSFSFFFS